jgi:putative redox protein
MAEAPKAEEVLVAETGRGKFQVEARAGSATLVIDEPKELGGLGSGPNPYDLLCAALGACTTMTIRMYADQKQWPLAQARVSVTHARRTLKTRDAFDRLIKLDGDLTEEQRQRLVSVAERCPVHLTLTNGADIRTTLAPASEPAHTPSTGAQHRDHMEEACGY